MWRTWHICVVVVSLAMLGCVGAQKFRITYYVTWPDGPTTTLTVHFLRPFLPSDVFQIEFPRGRPPQTTLYEHVIARQKGTAQWEYADVSGHGRNLTIVRDQFIKEDERFVHLRAEFAPNGTLTFHGGEVPTCDDHAPWSPEDSHIIFPPGRPSWRRLQCITTQTWAPGSFSVTWIHAIYA